MKLSEHIEDIRRKIDQSFRNQLGRMGISSKTLLPDDLVPLECQSDRKRIEEILRVLVGETGSTQLAYEKLVEEFTFTLFNRIAALKVMEAHTLHPEIITRRQQHGDRSFAHLLWLEQNPEGRSEELEGLVRFFEEQLDSLSGEIPLFSTSHPWHLLPTAVELNLIMQAFNRVENDPQVEPEIWRSDDVLGWLYESYNTWKKIAHKESGLKTEYDKVSIQSQVYTPRWVVKFLVDNSLGKLYLEMFPDSPIKERYKIANAPQERVRQPKSLWEVKLMDPAPGSGNFLLYAFDLFYDLYVDQIENYGASYKESRIPEYIISHNLHGIDLDDRAVQIAQLGLYIKVKLRNSDARIESFNVVSSDFYLPDYEHVRPVFEENGNFNSKQKEIIQSVWADLKNAYKFGSLVRLEEKLSMHLHGLKMQSEGPQLSFFSEQTLADYEQFRDNFFGDLQSAVAQNAARQGLTFLNTKTRDAIVYLKLLTQQYDIAVTNPPYTDSADFGPELKRFIEENYRKPNKFNSNLYAAFIKRCFELIEEEGKMAMIHPLTFMYIKSYEDVRMFVIDNLHINVFVDYGLSNLFGAVMVDPAFYVFEKHKTDEKAWFISLDQYTRTPQEKFKKEYCLKALEDYCDNRSNKHSFTLSQSKLKIIEGWPLIYWISDGFREKFNSDSLSDNFNVAQGIATANNERFVRYWWEIENNAKKEKWINYSKGGPYNKWYGNNWTVVNWENNGYEIRNITDENGKIRSRTQNEKFYFKTGVTYTASGSKGASFRFLKANSLFDVGGSCVFPTKDYKNINYLLALLNSSLSFYIIECLNPTVNTQVGDLQRIPFVIPNETLEKCISDLSAENIEIKKILCANSIIESNFQQSPLIFFIDPSLKERSIAYFDFENQKKSQVLLNEAIINKLIFEVYELSNEDREQVEAKMGIPVGQLPVLPEARDEYVSQAGIDNPTVLEYIKNLPEATFAPEEVQAIKSGFETLYQTNNDLEEFCIRNKVNPINVWYWFKESKIVPPGRAAEISLEFLTDAIRTLLMEDEDGIIPLTGLPGEPRLLDRLEEHCLKQGFTSAQFLQLEGLLGRPLNEYIEHHFFRNLSDHLNLFMYLPKTPFIWHLSSGEQQGFEAYIIIYKWNRDSLFKLKSQYLSHRKENLEYRQIQLQDSNTAQAQNEKEKIRLQLLEIDDFTRKIDELIAEGYNPILDDGVGKNIAPLQKKGLLRTEVLKTTGGAKSQLEKYLNADW